MHGAETERQETADRRDQQVEESGLREHDERQQNQRPPTREDVVRCDETGQDDTCQGPSLCAVRPRGRHGSSRRLRARRPEGVDMAQLHSSSASTTASLTNVENAYGACTPDELASTAFFRELRRSAGSPCRY